VWFGPPLISKKRSSHVPDSVTSEEKWEEGSRDGYPSSSVAGQQAERNGRHPQGAPHPHPAAPASTRREGLAKHLPV